MANYLSSSSQMAVGVNLGTSLLFLSGRLFASEKRLRA